MTETLPARPGWTGSLALGPGWAVWRGAIGDGAMHRHFAAQAVIAPAPVGVVGADGQVAQARCILVDPLAPHRLEVAPDAELVYLEPSRRMSPEAASRLAPLREAASIAVVRRPGAASFWGDWLSRPDAGAALDPRVETAVRTVDAALPEPPSLAAAAAASGLSVDRFRHLFARDIGLTYGRYVLWGRLRLAAAELLGGRDATTAAHAAGFADAAHFARTLKSTFGVTASQTLLATRSGS